MRIEQYDKLPESAKRIRTEVFVEEQGFENEFDEIDRQAIHLVVWENEEAIAVCRVYFNDMKQSYVIGRIAVRKPWRGQGIGEKVVLAAEEAIVRTGGKTAMLSGQVRVVEFYKKAGYQTEGEIFLDEDCPHIWMKKSLKDSEV